MNLRESLESRHADMAQPVLDRLASVDAVRRLEDAVADLPQIDLSTENLVHGGMCARTVLIPAGTVLTGALTNMDNVCVMFGDIEVTTDEGAKRLTGYHVLPARAGAKRAGFAHADTWWTTIWPTDLTDIEAIEDEATSESARLQTRRLKLEGEH